MYKLGSLSIAAVMTAFVSTVIVGLSSQQRPATARNDPPAAAPAPAPAPPTGRSYVGSQECRRCATAPFTNGWSKTRVANVVTDPREHPDVVLPDFNKPDPLLTSS